MEKVTAELQSTLVFVSTAVIVIREVIVPKLCADFTG
jgi:hypothetical protein